jgi:hypothetical protein
VIDIPGPSPSSSVRRMSNRGDSNEPFFDLVERVFHVDYMEALEQHMTVETM